MDKRTLLCVDDEKIILDSLKSQLKKRFGNMFNYEIASDSEEAMEIIEELNEDGVVILIIVSDWLMPGIKGDEFLIKVHERFPNIIKIMLTGQADEACIKNAFDNANLYCCINKPWKEEELFRAVEDCI
ncbi:response regulator [Clostridium sp. BL-8]|uniref:response regulator n=1 Tax=Clostridium sp. BL-8 TaxID=349938 RepID=UPI00098C4891|nr:response regulator [Clostridium sp. BL-8]OOM81637.1 hydrogenase transcriptional regulatory protein hupR1 [Clostridium sp. BL-8]